jgi:predicted dehydrogenase
MPHNPTRRDFLKTAAASTAAVSLAAPAIVHGVPSKKLNIAGVGVGGKGWGDITETSMGHNVVAICDVDHSTTGRAGLGRAAKRFPKAKRYADWRKLLEQKDIDAVTVSTPDHMHAPIATAAMQLGKHVYVQKPLAHDVYEARQLAIAARKHRVVTQMGNQGHSGKPYRSVVQLIQSGVIGKVKQAHTWSNRPIWPQGMNRPSGSMPVPESLHWDLWLGVAPPRPYYGKYLQNREAYHPFTWRGWLDFGTGALGDMGCHIIDPVVWSLELGPPRRIWSDGPAPNRESWPKWGTVHWQFPGTKYTAGDSIQLTWYDGGKLPPAGLVPLPEGEKLYRNGCVLIGESGVLACEHGRMPRLLPAEKFADVKFPELEDHNHYQQWSSACLGDDKTTSHFDYAGPLTETVLLGNVAVRFPGTNLQWNSEKLEFTNHPEANAHLRRKYRKGWEVAGL